MTLDWKKSGTYLLWPGQNSIPAARSVSIQTVAKTLAGTHNCLVHTMDASLGGGLNLKTVA